MVNELNRYQGTIGDAVGQGGTMMGMIAPGMVTTLNRLGDTPNTNYYRGFGERGLDSNEESARIAKAVNDEALKDIDLYSNASVKNNRESARTINVQRALDTVTHMQTLKAREQLTKNLMQTMGQIQAQKTGLLNQQDQVIMKGEALADVSNRQDRDSYYTNINQDINTAATYMQKQGADMNAQTQNRMFLDLLPTISQYGFNFSINPDGSMNMGDGQGNIKKLGETKANTNG